jgi:hypothetical protein
MLRHDYYDIMTLVVMISYNLLPNPETNNKMSKRQKKKSALLLGNMGMNFIKEVTTCYRLMSKQIQQPCKQQNMSLINTYKQFVKVMYDKRHVQ